MPRQYSVIILLFALHSTCSTTTRNETTTEPVSTKSFVRSPGGATDDLHNDTMLIDSSNSTEYVPHSSRTNETSNVTDKNSHNKSFFVPHTVVTKQGDPKPLIKYLKKNGYFLKGLMAFNQNQALATMERVDDLTVVSPVKPRPPVQCETPLCAELASGFAEKRKEMMKDIALAQKKIEKDLELGSTSRENTADNKQTTKNIEGTMGNSNEGEQTTMMNLNLQETTGIPESEEGITVETTTDDHVTDGLTDWCRPNRGELDMNELLSIATYELGLELTATHKGERFCPFKKVEATTSVPETTTTEDDTTAESETSESEQSGSESKSESSDSESENSGSKSETEEESAETCEKDGAKQLATQAIRVSLDAAELAFEAGEVTLKAANLTYEAAKVARGTGKDVYAKAELAYVSASKAEKEDDPSIEQEYLDAQKAQDAAKQATAQAAMTQETAAEASKKATIVLDNIDKLSSSPEIGCEDAKQASDRASQAMEGAKKANEAADQSMGLAKIVWVIANQKDRSQHVHSAAEKAQEAAKIAKNAADIVAEVASQAQTAANEASGSTRRRRQNEIKYEYEQQCIKAADLSYVPFPVSGRRVRVAHLCSMCQMQFQLDHLLYFPIFLNGAKCRGDGDYVSDELYYSTPYYDGYSMPKCLNGEGACIQLTKKIVIFEKIGADSVEQTETWRTKEIRLPVDCECGLSTESDLYYDYL